MVAFRMATRSGDSVVALDVIAFGAIAVVVIDAGPRKL